MIKAVLTHEIVHAAETSNESNEFADAVLDAYDQGNTEQMEADLAEIAKQYSDQAGQTDAARSELVAKRLSNLLNDNPKALDRLIAEKPNVAQRIWQSLKDFIAKMTGVHDKALDVAIELEKRLERALNSRDENASVGVKFKNETVEPDERTKYNRFGWIRANDVLSPNEWHDLSSRLKMYEDGGYTEQLNADGMLMIESRDDNGDLGIIAIADKDSTYPTVSRVYRLRWKDNPVLAEEAESEIVAYERTWGYDAYKFIEKYENVGAVEIYYAQDYRADQSGTGSERMDFVGTEVHRYPERIQNGEGSNPEAGRSGNVTEEGISSTSPHFSLPSTDILNDQIARHQAEQNAQQQEHSDGERQFVAKTLPGNPIIPQWAVEGMAKLERL